MISTGVRNVFKSYKFQLSLKGSYLPRLAYLTVYWSCYLYAKYFGLARGDWGKAHLSAWRFLSRTGLSRRIVSVRLPNGIRLEIDLFTSHMILQELYGDDIYQIDEKGMFPSRSGQVIFDVGAQQGVFAMLAAHASRNLKVVAIEPEPDNFRQLARNIELNGFGEVIRPLQLALSDKPGSAQLHRSRYNMGGHSLSNAAESLDSIEVRLSTLDALVQSLGLGCDLLKIDVEGHALAVLKGGKELLRNDLPNIVLEMERPEDAHAIEGILAPLGYSLRTEGSILFARSPQRR